MTGSAPQTEGPGKVLLVDDHPAMREVLRSLLEEVGGWRVVGEAGSGEEALPLVEHLQPDVVLMDCKMPGQGGVATTREIFQRWPGIAVVAHTAYADEAYVKEMVAAGARGYILKGDAPSAILEALTAAVRGGARLSSEVAGPVMEDLRTLYEQALRRSAELERENADLSQELAHLEEVDRLKDEFLALVSHELRSPITVILGTTKTLHNRPDLAETGDGQEMLSRMLRQGARLRDMVEQILQASAFAADRSPALRNELVPLVELLHEVASDKRAADPDHPILVQTPPAPRTVYGDTEALRSILSNLIDNAGKHAPPHTPIEIGLDQPYGWTRIVVADHGPGVALGDRDRIFAPFTQLDASTTRRVGGVGLGLFLVDRLVRGMSGRVWVDETPGGGATFVVDIPEAQLTEVPVSDGQPDQQAAGVYAEQSWR
ncbi:MAG TPA: ATP-binding protein [Actinomycetes bacterium]|nr:ATP-binding protein [Actinomycetes bacterium]